jgi:two-component system sensor histidine kinase KdpD
MTLVDFSEIDQVLTNLVENTLTYTPPGTPISIKARRVDERIEVSVRDFGSGVPGEHLPHLFDKFYRVDKRNRSMGTGLGLAITKGFVEAHGGHIWAQNAPDGGLVVTFSIPVASAEGSTKVEARV